MKLLLAYTHDRLLIKDAAYGPLVPGLEAQLAERLKDVPLDPRFVPLGAREQLLQPSRVWRRALLSRYGVAQPLHERRVEDLKRG